MWIVDICSWLKVKGPIAALRTCRHRNCLNDLFPCHFGCSFLLRSVGGFFHFFDYSTARFTPEWQHAAPGDVAP
jgi:hypothetical protein